MKIKSASILEYSFDIVSFILIAFIPFVIIALLTALQWPFDKIIQLQERLAVSVGRHLLYSSDIVTQNYLSRKKCGNYTARTVWKKLIQQKDAFKGYMRSKYPGHRF